MGGYRLYIGDAVIVGDILSYMRPGRPSHDAHVHTVRCTAPFNLSFARVVDRIGKKV